MGKQAKKEDEDSIRAEIAEYEKELKQIRKRKRELEDELIRVRAIEVLLIRRRKKQLRRGGENT